MLRRAACGQPPARPPLLYTGHTVQPISSLSSPRQAHTALRLPPASLLALLLAISVATLLLACASGSVALGPGQLWQVLQGQGDALATTLLQLRLERALTAWITGAALALAGLLMQSLLRNPLADPYVMGVSGGASVGALLALWLGLAVWQVDLAAVAGALVLSGVLFWLARRDFGRSSGTVLLLLTGALLSTACGAVISLLLTIAQDNQLRGMVFWLVGDISGTPLRPWPWLVLLPAMLLAWWQAPAINLLALHGDHAATLGVPLARLRRLLLLLAASLTATAVSQGGSIGFVGLMVPHACRLVCGPNLRLLIPASILAGASLLVLADTLARTVVAPMQLPVGILTALLGVPVLFWQLSRTRRRLA